MFVRYSEIIFCVSVKAMENISIASCSPGQPLQHFEVISVDFDTIWELWAPKLPYNFNVSNYSAMFDVGGATCRKFPSFSCQGYSVWFWLQNVYSRFARSFQI